MYKWILDADKNIPLAVEMKLLPTIIKETNTPGEFMVKGLVAGHGDSDKHPLVPVTCFIHEDISKHILPHLKVRKKGTTVFAYITSYLDTKLGEKPTGPVKTMYFFNIIDVRI